MYSWSQIHTQKHIYKCVVPIFGFVQPMGIVSVTDDVENVYLWNMCVRVSIVESSDPITQYWAPSPGLMKQNENGPRKSELH